MSEVGLRNDQAHENSTCVTNGSIDRLFPFVPSTVPRAANPLGGRVPSSACRGPPLVACPPLLQTRGRIAKLVLSKHRQHWQRAFAAMRQGLDLPGHQRFESCGASLGG